MYQRASRSGFVVLFLVVLLTWKVESEYQVVWLENFQGTSLNARNWEYEIDCWGGGNQENQCYVKDPSILKVANGLFITPRYYSSGYQGQVNGCTQVDKNFCVGPKPVTSARIRTKDHFSWLYGKFEIVAQLPQGQFLWPAVWMLPANNTYGEWAASGEIDILEFRSQDPKSLEQTLHFGGVSPNSAYQGSGKIDFSQDFTTGYHKFTLEWVPEKVSWLVDDKETFSIPLNRSFWNNVPGSVDPYGGRFQAPFDQSFYLIVNLAIGGNFFPVDAYGQFNASEASKTWQTPYVIKSITVWQDPNISPINTNPQPSSYYPQSSDIVPGSDIFVPNPAGPVPPSVWDWFFLSWQNPTIVGLGALVIVQTIALICCCVSRRRNQYSHIALSDY